MIVNEKMYQLGSVRSVIRELFEYGKKRAELVGKENIITYSEFLSRSMNSTD